MILKQHINVNKTSAAIEKRQFERIPTTGLKISQPIKSDIVSFRGGDFLSKPTSEILDSLAELIQYKKNQIGDGAEANIYRIPREPYVLKIPHESKLNTKGAISFDINEQDEVDFVVAKLDNNIRILKYIEGYPLSLPERFVKAQFNENILNVISQNDVDKMVTKLPFKAFHQLYKQICNVQKKDMLFDASAANVILNPKKKTLIAIDFIRKDEDNSHALPPLFGMYEARNYVNEAESKKIMGLMISGVSQEFKPGVKPCTDISEVKIIPFLNKYANFVKKESPESFKDFKKLLSEIEKLKNKELNGQDTKALLTEKLRKADEMIKLIFLK